MNNTKPAPDCTAVSPDCPVEDTIYGYYPNLSVNVFSWIAFGVLFFIQIYQTFRWKTWYYGIALTLGCFAESVGRTLPLPIPKYPLLRIMV